MHAALAIDPCGQSRGPFALMLLNGVEARAMRVAVELPEFVDVIVDVPLGGFVKRDDQGRLDYVAPLPAPFNYGSVLGTRADDGDRVDAVILGRRLHKGSQVRVPVHGVVHFIDAGHADPKWICSAQPLTAWQWRLVVGFFRSFAVAKSLLNLLRGESGTTEFRGLELRS